MPAQNFLILVAKRKKNITAYYDALLRTMFTAYRGL